MHKGRAGLGDPALEVGRMSIDIRCDECGRDLDSGQTTALHERCFDARVNEASREGYARGRVEGEADGYARGFAEGKTEGVMGVGEIE